MIALVVLSLITIVAIYWARHLALAKHRRVTGWMFATAMFPPLALVLWAMPERRTPVGS